MKKNLLSGLALLGLLVSGALVAGCTGQSKVVTQPAGGPKPMTSEAGAGTGGGTTDGGNAAAAAGPTAAAPALLDD
jgi:hypothetical protein